MMKIHFTQRVPTGPAARTCFLFRFFSFAAFALLLSAGSVSSAEPANPSETPKFKVLALTEPGGIHLPFVNEAKAWLEKCSQKEGFAVDYVYNTDQIDEEYLKKYKVFLQLNYPPYNWKPQAAAAFKAYIENGLGGWVGFHHATLLGNFDGFPMWPWFSDFMGKIKFKNYIAKFASGTVQVETPSHPCMKDVPKTFVIPKEEWYTWDRSPRDEVRVLATVDEASYRPPTDIKMGADHPVIWTNEHVRARNVYIFMGHGPDLFQSEAFTTIFRNALLWTSGQ
jgi:type 1 glutamine amidotransferase